jgi:hypothetical protein
MSLGQLALLTPENTLAAAAEIKTGIRISLNVSWGFLKLDITSNICHAVAVIPDCHSLNSCPLTSLAFR